MVHSSKPNIYEHIQNSWQPIQIFLRETGLDEQKLAIELDGRNNSD